MRIPAILFAVFLAGMASAETAPMKRLTLRQDVLGFEAVGRLDLGRDGYCTGVLIAPELVLTAAHCMYDKSTGLHRDISEFRFRAGLRDGTAIAESGIARSVAHALYDPLQSGRLNNIVHDVALLELAAPIPAATAAPFSVRSPGRAARSISVVSFARGRDAALSWQDGCSVVGRQSGLLAFDCDVYYGSSGAPVFDRSGNRPEIIAIISAGSQENGKMISIGMELPGPVSELRKALRTGAGVQVAGGPAVVTPRRIMPGKKAEGGARFVRP